MYRLNLTVLELFLLLALELPVLVLALIVASRSFRANLRSFSRHKETWRTAQTHMDADDYILPGQSMPHPSLPLNISEQDMRRYEFETPQSRLLLDFHV